MLFFAMKTETKKNPAMEKVMNNQNNNFGMSSNYNEAVMCDAKFEVL